MTKRSGLLDLPRPCHSVAVEERVGELVDHRPNGLRQRDVGPHRDLRIEKRTGDPYRQPTISGGGPHISSRSESVWVIHSSSIGRSGRAERPRSTSIAALAES
jgi:hypothetical protein